jgi:hypothetical protein
VEQHVGTCSVLLAVVGKGWVGARDETGRRRLDDPLDLVRFETASALKRDIPVIPILVQGASMPRPDELPDEIRGLVYRNCVELTHARWESDVQLLIDAIGTYVEGSKIVGNTNAHTGRRGESVDLSPLASDGLSTGPLTICAILKGAERRTVGDAYPVGQHGVHFVFSLFNRNTFDFQIDEVFVDVLAYSTLDLDHLLHGVGATDVKRFFRATVRPVPGQYLATYSSGQGRGEFVKILPGASELFDVEISATDEGIYELRVRTVGFCAGKRFESSFDSTRREVVFFDRDGGYRVDRGHGINAKRLTYSEYSQEMKSRGLKDY